MNRKAARPAAVTSTFRTVTVVVLGATSTFCANNVSGPGVLNSTNESSLPRDGGGYAPSDASGTSMASRDGSMSSAASNSTSTSGVTGHFDSGPPPAGALKVVMGTGGSPGHIVDGNGQTVELNGVNVDGTEYACVFGNQVFEVPPTQTNINTLKSSWNVNAVRVPVNEQCWLGVNGLPALGSTINGADASGNATQVTVDSSNPSNTYRSQITQWVNLITSNGMVAIFDMHFYASGTNKTVGQGTIGNQSHSVPFWQSAATAFKNNGKVIFDLVNEPNTGDKSSWQCWANGTSCPAYVLTATGNNGPTPDPVGMLQLLEAVRGQGAQNVVLMGGLGQSLTMDGWLSAMNGGAIPGTQTDTSPVQNPIAPKFLQDTGTAVSNVAASWHYYDGNSSCVWGPHGCDLQGTDLMLNYNAPPAPTTVLAAGYPIVLGETGITPSATTTPWWNSLIAYLKNGGQGFTAFSWSPHDKPAMLTDTAGRCLTAWGAVAYQQLTGVAAPANPSGC